MIGESDATQNQKGVDVAALKLRLESAEARVSDLDKAHSRGLDLLKWGMGLFGSFALVFAGFNWFTARTNYERDKDYLKQQVDLLEKTVAVSQREINNSNDKRLSDMENEIGTNLAKLFVLNDNKLLGIEAEARTNLNRLFAEKATAFVGSISNLQAAITNLNPVVQAQLDDHWRRVNAAYCVLAGIIEEVGALPEIHPCFHAK